MLKKVTPYAIPPNDRALHNREMIQILLLYIVHTVTLRISKKMASAAANKIIFVLNAVVSLLM